MVESGRAAYERQEWTSDRKDAAGIWKKLLNALISLVSALAMMFLSECYREFLHDGTFSVAPELITEAEYREIIAGCDVLNASDGYLHSRAVVEPSEDRAEVRQVIAELLAAVREAGE